MAQDLDSDTLGERRVAITGSSIYLVVYPTESQISLLRMETSRGKEILTFEEGMIPKIARDFQPLLMGDRVDVQLAQIVKLLRQEVIEPLLQSEERLDRGTDTSAPPSLTPKHCGACGTEASASARFCPSCGENLNPLPGERAFCESCGAPRTRSSGFCSQCGTKYGE